MIVTYQHARYIAEAITSALTQGSAVREVLVIDDGSPDDTVALARAVRDPRVRVIGLAHRGIELLAETYERAVEEASGDLVAILEGDDKWPPGKLEAQLHHFSDPDVVLSHGAYGVIGSHGTLLRERIEESVALPEGPYDALPPHLLASYIMPVTVVVRRRAILHRGAFRQLHGTPHWDYPTFLRLAEKGKFAHTSRVVGWWRKHARSGTMMLAGRDLNGAELAMAEALKARARHPARPDLPSDDAVRHAWLEASTRNALEVARVLLTQRKFSEARRVSWSGLRRARSVGLRARLGAVLVGALTGIDIERAARWWRRSPMEDLA